MGFKGRKQNSVKQIVEFLDLTVIATEGQIQKEVFGYYRKSKGGEANKKYADMLRRGLAKGLYNCFEMKVPGMKSRVFYFGGSELEMIELLNNKLEELKQFALKQEELI
jgi:hypothetical protein